MSSRRPWPGTPADRRFAVDKRGCGRMRQEELRSRDEGGYYIRLLRRLSRQICTLDDPNGLYDDFCKQSKVFGEGVTESHATAGSTGYGAGNVVEGAQPSAGD
jgi:hypothetical protein